MTHSVFEILRKHISLTGLQGRLGVLKVTPDNADKAQYVPQPKTKIMYPEFCKHGVIKIFE